MIENRTNDVLIDIADQHGVETETRDGVVYYRIDWTARDDRDQVYSGHDWVPVRNVREAAIQLGY